MKKTLFLTAVLGLVCSVASAKNDVYVPQSIIKVQDGTTVYVSTELSDTVVTYTTCTGRENEQTISDVLGQTQQFNADYVKRSAIVKDGQGTLVVDDNVAMSTPLLVREGTLLIKDATITNNRSVDGASLSVSGMNAELVLDNGHYEQIGSSETSSIAIGSIDGDATVTLMNKSSITNKQTIFMGSNSTLPMVAATKPEWNANPHRGGSYVAVDTNPESADEVGPGNAYYREVTNSAGFLNSTPSSTDGIDTYHSTATVNVLSGSTISAGRGLYVENATLNIDGKNSAVTTGNVNTNDQIFIGNGYGTKSVINITNGGFMSTGKQVAYISANLAGSTSEINISGAGSELSLYYAYIGYTAKDNDSSASISVSDNGFMFAQLAYMGSYYGAENKNTITLTNGSGLGTQVLSMRKASTITTDSKSTIGTYQCELSNGATIINHGTIYSYFSGYTASLTLKSGSRLQTGEMFISGREENASAEESELSLTYRTGLENTTFSINAGTGTVTLGALLTGKGTMQYLKIGDMESINNAVLTLLAPEISGTPTIAYKHEIGENITINYTTDHLNKHNGQEFIAVNGGAIRVEEGIDHSHEDTKVGTIGSFVGKADETKARVAVGETNAGSSVQWEGTKMETIKGEVATLIKGTNVIIGKPAADETPAVNGTLTVVKSSTLNNQGSVQTDNVVVQGTLDNNGEIHAKTVVEQGGTLKGSGTLGATTVESGGSMVVGNSPGAPTIEGDLMLRSKSKTVFSVAGLKPYTGTKLTGWESGEYSHITITSGGSLTLEDGAVFVIEFGGDIVASIGSSYDFDLTLVTAKSGTINLSEEALTSLLNNTILCVSDDPAANGAGRGLGLDRSGMSYTIENGGKELHLKGSLYVVPEPATATLSLLALAALAARRKRK